MWEVDVTLIEGWLYALDDDDYDLVIAALDVLQDDGPTLGRPLVDTDRVAAQEHEGVAPCLARPIRDPDALCFRSETKGDLSRRRRQSWQLATVVHHKPPDRRRPIR